MRNAVTKKTVAVHAFLILSSAVVLAPVIWMVAIAFSSATHVFQRVLLLFPRSVSLAGFAEVFRETPFVRWGLNSIFVASVLTSGQLAIGVLAAYALARYRFRGREVVFFLVLCTMMVPPQAIMLPTFLVVNDLQWVNTYRGVIIPHLASGYVVFLLRQFFMQIPRELEEASTLDGCNSVQTLLLIYLRPSLAVLAGVGVIEFVSNWNDYYWPLLVLMSTNKMTLPLAVVNFRNDALVQWVPTMAAATLSILPAMTIYVLAQRHFTSGFMQSGIK